MTIPEERLAILERDPSRRMQNEPLTQDELKEIDSLKRQIAALEKLTETPKWREKKR